MPPSRWSCSAVAVGVSSARAMSCAPPSPSPARSELEAAPGRLRRSMSPVTSSGDSGRSGMVSEPAGRAWGGGASTGVGKSSTAVAGSGTTTRVCPPRFGMCINTKGSRLLLTRKSTGGFSSKNLWYRPRRCGGVLPRCVRTDIPKSRRPGGTDLSFDGSPSCPGRKRTQAQIQTYSARWRCWRADGRSGTGGGVEPERD